MNGLGRALRLARRAARRLHTRLGTLGIVGLALFGLAAALALYAPTVERAAEQLQGAAEEARQQLDEAKRQAAADPRSARQLAALRGWIPPVERANADLRSVFEAAHKSKVALARGDYALRGGDDAGGVARLEIVLPLRERYGAIKAFVAEVLNELPHASLSELQLERPTASAELLDARVRLTVFYRSGQP
jgi:hypothetical protein